jgi:hypothetical protein
MGVAWIEERRPRMAKSRKSAKKPASKFQDLEPKKDPKGGKTKHDTVKNTISNVR